MRASLSDVLSSLRRLYGSPTRREPKGAFAMILYENASYLVDDSVKAKVFGTLTKRVGATPAKIAVAKKSAIAAAIADGGMLPAHRATKLIRAAEIAAGLDEPLDAIVARGLADARRVLEKFPSIGRPGADKIALFAAGHRVLPLESNGLRVLVRLGFASEAKDYGKTYRAAQTAVASELPLAADALVRGHLLLRTHGQEICKRTKPRCEACPLSDRCAYFGKR